MNKFPTRTKLIAAVIGVLMAVVLAVGGTFAWLVLSRTPEVKKMKVNVTNTTILEIAQAYPENYLTGPPEVGEDDYHKTRIVDGYTVTDQGVWGKMVDMASNSIALQEPATINGNTLSTIKYDSTGRTNGFQPLTKQDIDANGIVYYTRDVTEGNYRDAEGYIRTATSSEPVKVKCAGGISLWMRSNKPTSEDVLLKGLKITGADGQKSAEDDILGVVVNTYHLEKSEAAKKKEKETHQLQEGTLVPFNSYYAQKTDDGYTCTLFAGTSKQQMQPGELYLVEIIFYIEGNRENEMGNTAAISDNTGTTKSITFDSIDCRDVMYAAKVTEAKGKERKNGWFSDKPELKIELFGSSDEVDKKNIVIDYKLVDNENQERTLPKGQFKAFNDQGGRNSVTFDVSDGNYKLTVMTAQTDADGKILDDKMKYYTVNIGETSMVNNKEDSINVLVDTVDPVVEATLSTASYSQCECGNAEDDGTSYHNHDVVVMADVTEKNFSELWIGGRKVTAASLSQTGGTYRGERLYSKEDSYSPTVVAYDKAGRTDEKKLKFVIDKTAPAVKSIKWEAINGDALAKALNNFSGNASFNEAIQLEVTVGDEYINELTLSKKDADGQTVLLATGNKDPDNSKRYIATCILPKDFNGEVIITAKDKAGNICSESTGNISISDTVPSVKEEHDGMKANDKSDPVEWYDITYRLTAEGTNASHVTGFEFSRNNSPDGWYNFDQHMYDVYYKVGKTALDGDTITIYCDDYEESEGTIYFRPVTDIVDPDTGNYVRGNVLTRNYKLVAPTPAVPKVEASIGSATVSETEIKSLPPTNQTIRYELSGGDAYALEVDHYEYSSDSNNAYPKPGSTEWTDKKGITYKVSGDKNEVLEITGKEGEDIKANIYFRTVSTKTNDSSKSVYGPWSEMHSFEADRKAPVISTAEWSYVNEGNAASLISTLTGNIFFNRKIEVKVKSTDENIDEVTCDGVDASNVVNTKVGTTEIDTAAYVDVNFDDTLTFTAKDEAGNSTEYTTFKMTGQTN